MGVIHCECGNHKKTSVNHIMEWLNFSPECNFIFRYTNENIIEEILYRMDKNILYYQEGKIDIMCIYDNDIHIKEMICKIQKSSFSSKEDFIPIMEKIKICIAQ